MHNFFVCAYKSQDFAEIQKFSAWSHDGVTVTFRNACQAGHLGYLYIFCRL